MLPLRNDSVQGVVQVQRDVGAGVLVDGQRAAGVQNKEVYGADTELGELRNLADELGGDDVAPPSACEGAPPPSEPSPFARPWPPLPLPRQENLAFWRPAGRSSIGAGNAAARMP